MGETDISWARYTLNPWIGCAHRSEGCRNCYAETMAHRWGWAKWGVNAERRVTAPSTWAKPIAWDREAAEAGRRERVFCASLADVFDEHPGVVEPRARLWVLIQATPHLDWLLLTKRPENIAAMLPPDWDGGYPNVWLGTTVEDQRVAERIPLLRTVPAAARFLSCEPLIGQLDLHGRLEGIHEVIVGGESGAHARPMDLAWARDVVAAARNAGAAVHVKQLGAVWSGATGDGRDRADPAGTEIDRFPVDLRIREYPQIGTAA
ncbi:MAG: DUF5131 family protein [Vulcanimicrobiaceae bacterium]|jgi:protein gp37